MPPFRSVRVGLAALLLAALAAGGDVEPILVQAPEGHPGDRFAHVMDLDGGTLVVGAPGLDVPGGPRGAAHVLTRSGTQWVLQQRLFAADSPEGNGFGTSVAIDGDRIVVGAPGDDGFGLKTGTAYVFFRQGTRWTQEAKLTSDDAIQDDRLGTAVDVWGDRVVLGAPGEDGGGNHSGAAYVFARSGTAWVQEAKLLATDARQEDLLGSGVAIEGDRVVAAEDSYPGGVRVFERGSDGAWSQTASLTRDDEPGAEIRRPIALHGDRVAAWTRVGNQGAVVVFERRAGGWAQAALLVDPAGQPLGSALALDADTLLVGATRWSFAGSGGGIEVGGALVYRPGAEGWERTAELAVGDAPGDVGRSVALEGEVVVVGLTGPLPGPYGSVDVQGRAWVGLLPTAAPPLVAPEAGELFAPDPAPGDAFGSALAVEGDTLVVGAPGDFADGRGSVRVLRGAGVTWAQEALLVNGGVSPAGDHLGVSVALSGDTLLAGAPGDTNPNGSRAGAAHVFVRAGTTWTEQAKLLVADGTAQTNDAMGTVAALDGDVAALSALDGGPGTNVGAVHVFERTGGNWAQVASLFAQVGATTEFGAALALEGDVLVVGAPRAVLDGARTGAVYVVTRGAGGWGAEQVLRGSDSAAEDRFGTAVALLGDRLLVGAPHHRGEVLDNGTVYVFARDETGWTETGRLLPQGPAFTPYALGGFGDRLAFAPDRLVVSAAHHGGARRLYVYDSDGSGWTERGRFTASEHELRTDLSVPVALAGTTLLAGYSDDDRLGGNAGSVALFDVLVEPFASYCDATPNSTGASADLVAEGSNRLSAGDLAFRVTQLPPQASALLAWSPDRAHIPLADGTLCVGTDTLGFVHRMPTAGADASGTLLHSFDAAAAGILPASTWCFTCWFRDPAAGGAGSNFSDAVAITFLP